VFHRELYYLLAFPDLKFSTNDLLTHRKPTTR
jgi:hypothetical protein